jgi:DNA primase
MERAELIAIKEQAGERITEILDTLGIEYTERYQYIYAKCPIHGGDRQDAWSYHLELGVYQCFSRGCHEQFGKDIFGLVRGIKKCSFPEAVQFVKKFCNITDVDLKEVMERKKNKQFVDKIKRQERQTVVYPEETLAKLEYHPYLETRGFTKDLIESYQVGLGKQPYKRMYNRVVFPIRDFEGRIVGFTGRDVTGKADVKWIHSTDFDRDNNLFNIDRARPYIQKGGLAIVTEGPLDVLRLVQAGIHNGVAVLGRMISNGQLGLLMRAGATKLIFALDDDAAGITGMEKSAKLAEAFFDVQIVNVGGGRDIGDLTPEQAKEIFSEKICC